MRYDSLASENTGDFFSAPLAPNASLHLLPEAGAERSKA
jgi:hypothetical protein